jgi:hypothetical protein
MIKIENTEVMGWDHAIRGMRNPMNSWEKSDSGDCNTWTDCHDCGYYKQDPDFKCGDPVSDTYLVGPNDHKLMTSLAKGGPVHAKYRRMITVYLDITAPLYWWKEFDTYKVGTVANSCSTMHKIHAKEFELSDFSTEHLDEFSLTVFKDLIYHLNLNREHFIRKLHRKDYWWQMIQLLPSSYNQKRTVMLNYEVLVNIYESRRHHKLDEWHTFCDWIESLPYSEIIIGEKNDETTNH